MERSQPDRAGGDFVLLVDDVENLLALIVVEGALANQESWMGKADGHSHAGEIPGGECLVLVWKHSSEPQGSGLGIDLVINEVHSSPVRETVLIGQPQQHR